MTVEELARSLGRYASICRSTSAQCSGVSSTGVPSSSAREKIVNAIAHSGA